MTGAGGVSVSANNRPWKVGAPPVSPPSHFRLRLPRHHLPTGLKLTDAVLRQKAGETLTAADRDFSNADLRNITFSKILPQLHGADGDIIRGVQLFQIQKFTYSDISHLF